MTNTLNFVSSRMPFRLLVHACRKTWIDHRPRLFLDRPIWRIYRFPDGGGGVEFQGESIFPSPDELLLVPPNTPVRHLLKRSCWHYWLHVSVGFPYNSVKGQVFCQKLDSVGSVLFDTTYGGKEDSPSTNAKLASLIAHVLSGLPDGGLPVTGSDSRINRVLDAIDENTGADISNTKLAGVAGMSCNAFTRLFKKAVGQSPHAYILDRRLDEACALLTYTDQSIDIIAEQCGFRDRGYMTRVFSLKRDTTPARYRKQSRIL